MNKPTFYRHSKRFWNVEYPHAQIKISAGALRAYFANRILSSSRKFRENEIGESFGGEDILKRLSWMKKSRLLGIFYNINSQDAVRAVEYIENNPTVKEESTKPKWMY